jgi:hypothetical protein
MNVRPTRQGPDLKSVIVNRGSIFGVLIILAFAAFEVFNFSTTQVSLKDFLGNMSFAGITWATILSVAACGMDLGGIARIFTPEQGNDEPIEVWYLLGAWAIAATGNATLTWWGLKISMTQAFTAGEALQTLTDSQRESAMVIVPIVIAIIVFALRVLIITTFSKWADRQLATRRPSRPLVNSDTTSNRGTYLPNDYHRPSMQVGQATSRPVPTYTPVSSLRAKSHNTEE